MGYRLVMNNESEIEHGMFRSAARAIRSNSIANKADKKEYSNMDYNQLNAEKSRLEARIAEANTKLINAEANVRRINQELTDYNKTINTLKNDKSACEWRLGKIKERMINAYNAR